MATSGELLDLGSQGMGLLGSLEAQFGMLVCRWGGAVEEKEVRRGEEEDMVSGVMAEGERGVCVCYVESRWSRGREEKSVVFLKALVNGG